MIFICGKAFPCSESHSVVSNSLQPHGLYIPWNSAGQNTGVGSRSLPQGIFPTQGLKQVSYIAGRFFTSSGRYQNKEYILFNSVNSYSIRNELIIFTEFCFFLINLKILFVKALEKRHLEFLRMKVENRGGRALSKV